MPIGRRLQHPADVTLPLADDVDERLAVDGECHRTPHFQIVERRRVPVYQQMRVDAAIRRYFAVGLRDLAAHIIELRDPQEIREGHIDRFRDECQRRRRWILDDRIINPVEIGQPGFPVIRVAHHSNALVRLELDEFERASADWVLPHLGGRDVAGVDRREAASQQVQEARLRPLQVKHHLMVAVGGDLIEVLVKRFARIEAQLFLAGLQHQIPGAHDVFGGKGLAVMPFDALAQRHGQLGAVLAPAPAGRQIRYDRIESVLLLMLIEQHKIVEHAHHWALRARGRFLEDRHARRTVKIVHPQDAAAFLRRGAERSEQHREQRRRCDHTAKRSNHAVPPLCALSALCRCLTSRSGYVAGSDAAAYLSSHTSSMRQPL